MEKTEKNFKTICVLGGISTSIVLLGILLDMAVGMVTGGDVSALPQTAVERYNQLQENPLLGLYNLDLLNIINQIIFIPAYFALYVVHRKTNNTFALLALIVFLVGTTIFVAGNTALTLLDLSNKFALATTETQKMLFTAAGEAMLAKGAHGSFSVFLGFAIPTVAGILMSWVMVKGQLFNITFSAIGMAGNALMLIYTVIITFVPSASQFALVLAMPGGLMVIAWMIMIIISFFKLCNSYVTSDFISYS